MVEHRKAYRRFKFEWSILAVALLVVSLILGASLIAQRRQIATQEQDRLRASARVVSDNIIRQFIHADRALGTVLDDLRRTSMPTSSRLRELQSVTGLRILVVLDASGRVTSSSKEALLGRDLSRRDYFIRAREHYSRHDPSTLYIAPPFKGALSGSITVTFSRVIVDAHGAFAGVVAAALDPDYSQELLASLLHAPDARIWLVHGEGRILQTMPVIPELIGKDVAMPGSFFSRHRASGQVASSLTGIAASTGEHRMIALRTIRSAGALPMDYPLVVAMSRQSAVVFADWRTDLKITSGLFILFALAAAVGLKINQHRQWRLDKLIAMHAVAQQQVAERLELATRAARLGIWEYNPVDRRLNADATTAAIYGFDPATPMDCVMWRSTVFPEDLSAIESTLATAIKNGSHCEATFRIRRGDGEVRVIRSVAHIGYDAGGQAEKIVGIAEDITERWRSHAIEQSTTGVVITDRNGRIEYVNSACCSLYGYSEHELLGKKSNVFKSGSTAPEVYRQLWQTILGGGTWRGELTNAKRDGSLVCESLAISPVRDSAGEITHFVAIKEDISARQHAEHRRRAIAARQVKIERMQLLATLTAGIAHDFKNILVSIMGYSGLGKTALSRSQGDNLPTKIDMQNLQRYFVEIEVAGERAKKLLQHLSGFSHSGRISVQEVEIGSVIAEVVGLIEVTLPESVTLAPDIEENLPPLNIDPVHLHQLLLNLCVNAREACAEMPGAKTIAIAAQLASPKHAVVCASCHREFSGNFVRLSVRDDGCGISAADREQIFEPFFSTKKLGQGAGLGLAVVHGIAHIYDGHIQLSSETGHGTELTIYLPNGIA